MDPVDVTSPLSGILKVTLVQTRDVPFPTSLSTPLSRRALDPRPYAIVDFDKSQIISRGRYPGLYEPPVWAGEGKISDIHRYTYSFDVTRQAELQIWLYQPPARGVDVNTDAFLGKATLRPLLAKTSEITQEWLNLHDGVGAISIMTQFISTEPLTSMDMVELFDIRDRCPEPLSSLTKVVIVRKKNTQQDYARMVLRKGKHNNIALRPAAAQIDSPFIVSLKFRIKVSPGKLYLLCAFLHRYDLSDHLKRVKFLELTEARFYAAQIQCALDYLHHYAITYGRLQPRNIYIDLTGYLVLGDFDFYIQDISGDRLPRQQLPSQDAETHAPNKIDKPDQRDVDGYLAPELLDTQGDSHHVAPTADWWSFGVILHRLLTGYLPCNAANNADMPRSFPIPPNGIPLPQAAEDLLAKLLSRNPLQRLGANGSEEIKSHPFFDDIDWPKLLRKDYAPSFRPPLVEDEALILERPCAESSSVELQFKSDEQDRLWAMFEHFNPQAQIREP